MISPIRVVQNYNPNLLIALQEDGILPEEPEIRDIIGEEDFSIDLELYEGRDNWFILVLLPAEGAEEIIVPKIVSRDTAMNIAKYIVGKEACEEYEYMCNTNAISCKEYCKEEYKWCLEDYSQEECKEYYDRCLQQCENDERKCLEDIDKNYCKPARESELTIRREGLIPLECITGTEENSPDIDNICYFVKRT